ncbi:MAG: hypothetical protein H0U60_02270 [Blastocatellia bacterium]|nr:hypothetical protein [Blastocatellia bacterium]
MASNERKMDPQGLREDTRRERVVYEIYPDLTWQPGDIPLSWFEIALLAEVEEYQPPGHPRSREVSSVLMELAEFLIQQIRSQVPPKVDLSSCYTLHPLGCGDFSRPRLFLSLSLVFSDVVPYRKVEEPGLLTELKTQLSLLDISRLEVDRSK